MRNFILCILLLSTACFAVPLSAEDSAIEAERKRKLVYELFESQHLPEQLTAVIRNTVKLQTSAEPALAPYADSLTTFLNETSGYQALKKDLADIYLRHFTEAEIKTFIAFYRTPAGKKMAEQSESIFRATSVLVQSKLKENSEKLLKSMKPGVQQGIR